jgi:hypothetical protein
MSKALTFDTHTVISNGFDFDGGLLAQLKQFKGGPVQIVVSDVVVREIEKHLTEHTKRARDAMINSHRTGVRFGLASEKKSPSAEIDAAPIAKERTKAFLSSIGATVLSTEEVSLEAVLTRYFDQSPPFLGERGKQKEFPDAIALMALDAWATKSKKELLAVSGDGDWKAYAETSPNISHTSDLAEAMQGFQDNLAAATTAIQKLLETIEAKPESELGDLFNILLTIAVEDTAFDADGDSMYTTELTSIEVDVDDWSFSRKGKALPFKIVSLHGDLSTIEIPVRISVTADVSFLLSAYDSIDKDYVELGDLSVKRSIAFETSILVTFKGKLESNLVTVEQIELLETGITLQMGNLDRDMTYDE